MQVRDALGGAGGFVPDVVPFRAIDEDVYELNGWCGCIQDIIQTLR